jgi:hypothetical protein
VIAVIAAVLGGCAQDFDEDYGVYHSGDTRRPRRTAKIQSKIRKTRCRIGLFWKHRPSPTAARPRPRGALAGRRRTATAGLATPAAADEGRRAMATPTWR